jgi:hypothetical protein
LLHALSYLRRASARGDTVRPLPCFSGPLLLVAVRVIEPESSSGLVVE